MAEFNWIAGLLGGVLIGISATVLLALNGRIAGVSGIVQRAIVAPRSDLWRWYFLGGMLIGGLIYESLIATRPTPRSLIAPIAILVGGFLVGFGTSMSNGCTSGHGVCGLGRLSLRSWVAVGIFLSSAIVTVWIVRHGLRLVGG
jgi:uncharacterized protein